MFKFNTADNFVGEIKNYFTYSGAFSIGNTDQSGVTIGFATCDEISANSEYSGYLCLNVENFREYLYTSSDGTYSTLFIRA
jgi:hypothetical protein